MREEDVYKRVREYNSNEELEYKGLVLRDYLEYVLTPLHKPLFYIAVIGIVVYLSVRG